MREFLQAIWDAPQEQFLWFVGVLWGQFLYVAVVALLLRWLWRLGKKPAKDKK